MNLVALSPTDVALAAALILLAGLLSWGFRLGLERTIAVAALRMVVQVLAIGVALKLVLEQLSLWATVALAAAMALAAGCQLGFRQRDRVAGLATFAVGTGWLFAVSVAATLYAVAVVIRPEPWHAPRYLLPILGMVLGNVLTGVGLVLDTMTVAAGRERAAIESRLALGASRFVATGDVLRQGLRTGLTPILNAMAVAGLAVLPPMMSGQVLAGVDPLQAARYEIALAFLIAGATALGVTGAAFGTALLITDRRHRLRLDRLQPSAVSARP